VRMRRVCARCGRVESEVTGAQSGITHSMCATCVRERISWDVPAPETRGQRATQVARRHGVPGPPVTESDTVYVVRF
jgi:NMD protein affecting ribosome stability and mRNA decay